jgi:hypothetical protein
MATDRGGLFVGINGLELEVSPSEDSTRSY